MRWVVASCALALAVTVTTACGDDDGGSGAQGEVADRTIEQLRDGGGEVDEDCIRDIADRLSDEDAQALIDSDFGAEADAGLSQEGEDLGLEILDCVSMEGMDLGEMPDDSSMDDTEDG